MILFGVMSFVNDEKIYLSHGNERVHQTLIQYLGRTDDCHILLEMLIPHPFTPEIAIHLAAKPINLLVKIALQNSKLLKH